MFAFRAMNTEVIVTAHSGDEATVARKVAAIFWRAERRFSRFRHDSELSRLNRARGRFAVSAEMFDALSRARSYTQMTGGLFDPGIGATLTAFGYDRSFAPGELDRDEASAAPTVPGTFCDVVLERSSRTVERPPHLHVDLGGMIKGATVDAAADRLLSSGAVSAGGDVALRGTSASGQPWLVDIEDPMDVTRVLATLALSDHRAVATTAANRRRWRVGGSVAHHIIDPRTQRPAMTDLLQATVVAPRAELADVLAKTAFLLGADEGRRFLARQPNVGAVLVRDAGNLLVVGDVDLRDVAHG